MTAHDDPSRHEAEVARPASPDPHEQFTALLARHHTAIMNFILSLLPNWSDAEDILQQTSVVLWRKFGEFEPGTSFLAWSCQVARFHVLNHRRKQTRDRHLFSDDLLDTLASEVLSEAERLDSERRLLNGCIEKLDVNSRRLLSRCYAAGSSIKQVAVELSRTPNSIYKAVNRIRESLLRCVQSGLSRENT